MSLETAKRGIDFVFRNSLERGKPEFGVGYHGGGDRLYKSRHAMAHGEFVGDPRCEITRALTLDQILEKIGTSGGTVWAERAGVS
jgi:hypothetical protein